MSTAKKPCGHCGTKFAFFAGYCKFHEEKTGLCYHCSRVQIGKSRCMKR